MSFTRIPLRYALPSKWRGPHPLFLIIALGFLIRLLLLYTTRDMSLMIVDEQHYYALALNLLQGHGFAWGPGLPTSIRPPLYSFVIALIWMMTGTQSVLLVRGIQILLSLANVLILYRLGLLLFNRRVALLAAAGCCFYPSLLAFNFLLLTEVAFTLLLTVVALSYVVLVKTARCSIAWATGCALGLAALTRSVLWPFPVVLCPLAFFSISGNRWTRLRVVLFLFLGYALTVAPWAVRNTRLQGIFTVVDTMGGLNLRLGNYEYTPLNRAWAAVSLTGEQSWAYALRQEHPEAFTWTEGQKEKWAQKKALAYMLEYPSTTLMRAIIKFFDFWGLERTLIAGWQQGLYQPPRWFSVSGTLLITSSYALTMLLASLGLFLAPPSNRKAHLFLVLVLVFISGVHTVVFGHERYHLPLMPLLILYAAAAVIEPSWRRLREGIPTAAAPVLACLTLLVIWGREVFIVDADRIKDLLRTFFS
jgi:4-amino-4-deoxy-L-arabinose transferase-like glycosyltransferase